MNRKVTKAYSGYVIVGVIAVLLIVASLLVPTESPMNDFIAKLGSLVTIAGAAISYLAWSNTRKLMEQRKQAEIQIGDEDVIVGIEALRQSTDIESSIVESANNELPDLEKIVNGTKISVVGDSEFGIPGSAFTMRVSDKINRGILIKGGEMPVGKQDDVEEYINDYRDTLRRLYETLSRSNCTTIHLFIAAPGAITPFLMPFCVNKMAVVAYHYVYQQKKYIRLGFVDVR